MIIQERQLRPPTDRDLKARRIQLERLQLLWVIDWDMDCVSPGKITDPCDCPTTEGSVHQYAQLEIPVLDLIEFHKDYDIPYEATIRSEGDDGELWLDWTYLNRCPVCAQWYREGDDHIRDAMHVAVSRAKTAEGVMS